MPNLYITSPLRKEGKSFISSGLAATMQSLGYSTCVYKPVQTSGIEHAGFMQSPDLTFIKTLDPYINTQFTYLYKTNSEPVIAAELENETIDINLINSEYKKIISDYDCTIIDGDNGILSPIAPNTYTKDIIRKLNIPLLIVTSPSENSVNSTLLTVNTANESGINIRGVIVNNIKKDCDKIMLTSITRLIEEYTDIKVLGLLENLGNNPQPEDLITSILNGIDIESVFNMKIEKLDLA